MKKVHVWVGKSRIAGNGLYAGQDITKGTTILRYIGTKISKAKSTRELAKGNAYICYFNSNSRPVPQILYDLCRRALPEPLSAPRSRV